jgi:hypothetical protein
MKFRRRRLERRARFMNSILSEASTRGAHESAVCHGPPSAQLKYRTLSQRIVEAAWCHRGPHSARP